MSRIQLFGEFLLKNNVITSAQLLDALSFQKEVMRMQSILQLLGNTLSHTEYNAIIEKLGEGESVEQLALETGALSANEIHEIRLDKEFRLPLGEVLLRKGYLDKHLLDQWLDAFAKQDQNQDALTGLLGRSSFFRALSAEDLAALIPEFKYKSYSAGERIYGQGDESDGLYFIESGLVAMRVRAGQSQREINRYRTLECVGIEALLHGTVRTENAYATMDTVAWRLSPAAFHALLQKHPGLAIYAARQLSAR
ncbi:MAG: cyclic nucleotide-binding domain-containing protein, partial [Leptospiraceae bacterium]|nr:cyclic nucleotide-binding domain-containing protein [Leptospiraceae bacterium]